MVLYAVRLPAQQVILEVEQLESGVDVLDEVADLNSKLVVAQGDRVDSQAGQFIRQAGDGQQILLDGDVEFVTVLEVYGNWEKVLVPSCFRPGEKVAPTLEELSDLLEGQKPSNLALANQAAAQPAIKEHRKDSILYRLGPLEVVPAP